MHNAIRMPSDSRDVFYLSLYLDLKKVMQQNFSSLFCPARSPHHLLSFQNSNIHGYSTIALTILHSLTHRAGSLL